MKKIISVVVMIAILGLNISALAMFTDVVSTDCEYAVNTLTDIGIIVGDGKYEPYTPITREDFVKMVAIITGFKDGYEPEDGIITFNDVEPDNIYYPYIEFVARQKLINGYSDGDFRPKDPINFINASKILVDALGYTTYAENNGGYPTGYLSVSTSLKLNRNISVINQDSLSKSNAAILIYNAIRVDVVSKVLMGEKYTLDIEKGETLVSKNMGFKTASGIVTANSKTTLSDPVYISLNHIRIGDTIYNAGATNAKEYLGYSVRVYYVNDKQTNDPPVIVSIQPEDGKNKIFRINGEKEFDVSGTVGNIVISYPMSDDVKKNIMLDGNIDVIYNGKVYNAFTPSTFDITSGQVVLIDNNGDGNYDVALIYQYETYVVQAVNTISGIVYGKYGEQLDLSADSDGNVTIQDAKGKYLKPENLSENDILSVAKSKDGLLIEVNVINDAITGKVTAIETVNDSKCLTINDKKLIVSKYYNDLINTEKKEPVLGMEATFLLDIEGKIAEVKDYIFTGWSYGYIISAGVDGSAQFAKNLKLKILTDANKVQILNCDEKLIVDNESKTLSKLFSDARVANIASGKVVAVPQLVKYSLGSDGKIKKIDTAYKNPNTETDENLVKSLSSVGGTYNSNSKAFYTGRNVNFIVDTATILFVVPTSASLKTDDIYYYSSKVNFSNDQVYGTQIDAFDVDEALVAKALVRNIDDTYPIQTNSPTVLVDKVGLAINDKGEQVQIVTGLNANGDKYSMKTKDSNTLVGIVKGDIIRVRERDGRITAGIKEVDINTTPRADTLYMKSEGANVNTHNAELDIMFGYIVNKYKSFVCVSNQNVYPATNFVPFDLSGKAVLLYDSATGNVSKISNSEIFTYMVDKNSNAKIYIATNYGAIKSAIILK